MKNGFTLVELLVVVAIIAILGAIGISVFSGARQSATDGRRKSEIKSIADAIESSKDYTNRTYTYSATDSAKDFPRGLPDDPSGTRNYCIATYATNYSTPSACTTNWTSGCPNTTNCPGTPSTGYQPLTSALASGGSLTTAQKAWTVCAALDRGSQPYCLSSLER
ncbi:MAG: prepilin-type N-terminal cleavage/methylation domain-containing protein [Patescibacteria group bacterium]|nr:prepilin-type N-terminal cleavage/methylation domain-containing protein [Patescibacteria group bacterium]